MIDLIRTPGEIADNVIKVQLKKMGWTEDQISKLDFLKLQEEPTLPKHLKDLHKTIFEESAIVLGKCK